MNAFRFPRPARHTLAAQITAALIRALGISLAISGLVVTSVQADSPTIRLFPTTVMEDLRQTSSVAKEMESGLQEVIGRLDQ